MPKLKSGGSKQYWNGKTGSQLRIGDGKKNDKPLKKKGAARAADPPVDQMRQKNKSCPENITSNYNSGSDVEEETTVSESECTEGENEDSDSAQRDVFTIKNIYYDVAGAARRFLAG